MSQFPPQNIIDEVTQKGFSVYPYISLKELSMTIRKDFLNILDTIKYIFLIILGIGALFGQMIGFLNVLIFGYGLIFIYLLVKLIIRTRAFIYLNNVIFTPKNLITGYQVHSYGDPQLNKVLKNHEKIFDEYLGKDSKLAERINKKRNAILSKSAQDLKKVNKHIDFKDTDSGKVAIYFFLLITAYSLSLIVFYYIGILFVFAFFFIHSFFIKTYLFFFEQRELHVKNETEKIEDQLKRLQTIQSETEIKLKSFEDGQVFDLEKQVGKNIQSFYQTIEIISTAQKKLQSYIEKKFDKNLINFDQFEKYIWKQIKIPAKQMIPLLSQIVKNTNTQIEKTKKTIKETTDKHFIGSLEQKLFNLKRIKSTTSTQLEKFSKIGKL